MKAIIIIRIAILFIVITGTAQAFEIEAKIDSMCGNGTVLAYFSGTTTGDDGGSMTICCGDRQ